MSTTVVSDNRPVSPAAEFSSGAVTAVTGAARTQISTSRPTPLSDNPSRASGGRKDDWKKFRVNRRLKGFVADAQGETWRVIFIENGNEIPYDLPADPLRRVGIVARFQPFEMDEMVPLQAGVAGKLYRFLPLAEAKDALLETLTLDPERQQKRDRIFARFGKPKT